MSASILLRGEGRVIREGGAQKKKSPDFRSSEVGISATATRTTAAASGHRKSTLIELQGETISEILQQTTSVSYCFLNAPTVFEKVGPTISKWFHRTK